MKRVLAAAAALSLLAGSAVAGGNGGYVAPDPSTYVWSTVMVYNPMQCSNYQFGTVISSFRMYPGGPYAYICRYLSYPKGGVPHP